MSSSSIKQALEEAIESLTIGQLRRILAENARPPEREAALPSWVNGPAMKLGLKKPFPGGAYGPLKQRILDELAGRDGSFAAARIVEWLGSNKRFTHWTLNSLLRKGIVVRHGKRGYYTWSLP